MENNRNQSNEENYWFVGSYQDGKYDRTDEFIDGNIWNANNPSEKVKNRVRQIECGDKIAMKATLTKKDVPFENKGKSISTMRIKAIGEVLENPQDGQNLKVDWKRMDPPRDWYFFSLWETICKVQREGWKNESLIDFTFNGADQDYDLYVSHYDNSPAAYELLPIPKEILEGFQNWFQSDVHSKNEYFYKDQIKYDFLSKLGDKDFLEFFVEFKQSGGMIQSNGFRTASRFQKSIEKMPEDFREYMLRPFNADAFDLNTWLKESKKFKHMGLSMATIYLNRLDKAQYAVFNKKVREGMELLTGKKLPSDDYAAYNVVMNLQELMVREYDAFDNYYQVDAFQHYIIGVPEGKKLAKDLLGNAVSPEPSILPVHSTYSVEDIIDDGCFLEQERIQNILNRLQVKMNLILQGPPGTGKTWLAKRLAYALIGSQDESKVRSVQFHPNLSYEDFIRGWRPGSDGKLSLQDGPFLQITNKAAKDPENTYVIVIEEINRGNPAQIFGEMLTLLEADKRTEKCALELSYRINENERVHLPENLYLIGTMNIADRSLALVDFALRRRFAFVDLEPCFGDSWLQWVQSEYEIGEGFLKTIQHNMLQLNHIIANDPGLGKQYCIGHSYVTPSSKQDDRDSVEWYTQIVTTEIGPLLEEYWFDAPEEAIKAQKELLKGLV